MTALIGVLREFVKQNWHYILVIIFALILSVGIWGDIHTYIIGDDYAFHIARIKGTASALKEGQVLAQVSPNDMFGFGYGYNLFYGPLLAWLGTFLRFLVGAWPLAMNVLCIILMCLAGLLACYMGERISRQKSLALMVGVFYLAAPYHLINLYDRFALAEFAGMALLPLLILGLYQLVNHQKYAVHKIVIAASVLILTHSLSTLLAILLTIIYLAFNIKKIWNLATLRKVLIASALIVGGTAFFTLPLIEAKVSGTYGAFDDYYSSLRLETNPEKIHEQHLSISALVYSDYETAQMARDKMAIGVIAAVGLLGYWFVRKGISRRERNFVDAMYFLSIFSLFMTTSLVNWEIVPKIFYSIQFPWRFLSIFALTSSIISAYVVFHLIKRLSLSHQQVWAIIASIIAICLVGQLYTLPYVEHTKPGEEVEFSLEKGSPGWSGEYAPVALLCDANQTDQCGLGELSYNLTQRQQEDVKIISGSARLKKYQKSGTKVTLDLADVSTNTILELPLIWYPGYTATLNGQKLSVKASQNSGLVEVSLPNGATGGELSLHRKLTVMSRIGLAITLVTYVVEVIILIYQIKNHNLKKG